MKRACLLATAIVVMCNMYPAALSRAAGVPPVQKKIVRVVDLDKLAAMDSNKKTAKQKVEPAKTDKAAKAAKTDKAVKPAKTEKAVKPAKTDKTVEPVAIDQIKELVKVDKAIEPVPIRPLDDEAFSIEGIQTGDTLAQVESVFGKPDKYTTSEHYTTLQYDNETEKMRVVLRNDLAEILKQPGAHRKAIRIGVDSVFLTRGTEVSMGRNVHLGNTPEMLVRQYGIPLNLLRDAEANVYYLIYQSPDKDTILAFAVRDRKVQRIAMMPPRYPYVTEKSTALVTGTLAQRDFELMGFSLEQTFKANQYNMWVNMIPRKDTVFWLYGNYGMQVDRHNKIKRVFLMTNNAYTTRGATLGYHISSILALYGDPTRIEKGPAGSQYDDAYYYDSPYQKGASLVFVVKHDGGFVDDIILTDTPIKGLQDPMQRYGLS